MDTGITLRAT